MKHHKNTMHLEGLTLSFVGPIVELKHGKIKRELSMDYGRQKYLIDDIVERVTDFQDLKIGQSYDVIVYVNGIIKDGQRITRITAKKIRNAGDWGVERKRFDFEPLNIFINEI